MQIPSTIIALCSSRVALAFAVILASVVACRTGDGPSSNPVSRGGGVTGEAATLDAILAAPGNGCEHRVEKSCNDLIYVDCGAGRDGFAYYVRADNGRIISTCGGACRKGGDECETLCPPPAWTCGGTPTYGKTRPPAIAPSVLPR
jgi:hypothetical protein